MKITIEEITPERLGEYTNIPNAFMVRSIYQVESVDKGLGGMSMIEVPVEHPYIKDYDLEESPEDWPIKFNVANWGFFLAKADQRTVGAAAVAFVARPGHQCCQEHIETSFTKPGWTAPLGANVGGCAVRVPRSLRPLGRGECH